jgi:hypothetical protein
LLLLGWLLIALLISHVVRVAEPRDTIGRVRSSLEHAPRR